jgi:HSP20 family protein
MGNPVSVKSPPDGLDEVLDAVDSATRENVSRAPAIEIIEEPSSFVLACEMPGAEREDIRVDVSPHRVVVAALPRTAPRPRPAGYHEFERAIPLPSEVDPEAAEARLNNGVLEIVLPKKRMGGSGVYRLPSI